MPTIYEKFGSRDRSADQDGTGSTATLEYLIEGTNDDQTAGSLVETTSPLKYYGLKRSTISVTQVGPTRWEGSVDYKDQDEDEDQQKGGDHVEVGEGVWSFDTTGETIHITNSKKGKQEKYAPTGSQAPDLKGVIGAGPDAIEGVDIVSPSLRLTYRTRLPKGVVTAQYIKDVASITGTINDRPFQSFDTGELLFMGMNGEQSGSSAPELTFHFSAASNWQEERIYDTLDGDATVLKKGGWDYLWLYYIVGKETTAKKTVPVPLAVYVDTVYESKNFAELQIGVGQVPSQEDPPPQAT